MSNLSRDLEVEAARVAAAVLGAGGRRPFHLVVVAAAVVFRLARQLQAAAEAAAAAHLRMVVAEEGQPGHWSEAMEAVEVRLLLATTVEVALQKLAGVVVRPGRWKLVREEVLRDFSWVDPGLVARSEEGEAVRPSQALSEEVVVADLAG